MTLEDYRRTFPLDLQELVVVWDPEEVYALYAAVPTSIFSSPEKTAFSDFESALGYIPGTWFMHRFAAYDFAYMLETDVRFSGDWGHFLTAALNIASANEAPDWQGVPDREGRATFFADRPVPTELPADLTRLPDLLNFVPFLRSDKWAERSHNVTETKFESLMMLWGGSRKLFNAMHEWSRQGKAIFYESFMPTVAASYSLKMLSIDHPVYWSDEHPGHGSWHCCSLGGSDIYEQWLKSKHCLHPSLLHPVKLTEATWAPDRFNKWMEA